MRLEALWDLVISIADYEDEEIVLGELELATFVGSEAVVVVDELLEEVSD